VRSRVPLCVSEATARRLPPDVRGYVVPVKSRGGWVTPGRPLPPMPDATEEEIRRLVRRLRLGRASHARRRAVVWALLQPLRHARALACIVAAAPAACAVLLPPLASRGFLTVVQSTGPLSHERLGELATRAPP
jgi:hypothetical protein